MSDRAVVARNGLGLLADGLTAGRALLSVPLAAVAWSGAWTEACLLLAASWWSDLLDGRLARRSGGATRLGRWDLAADTAVGAGLLVGLVGGGHVPMPWWGGAGVLLAAGYVALRNPALGMLLQAIAYGPTLWFGAVERSPGFGVAVLSIVAIAVVDRARLLGYVLPTFFGGIVGRRRGE